MITAIILAAGASSRMGTPKALIDLDGSTYLVRIANTARAAGAGTLLVVAGPPDGDKVKAKLPNGVGVTWNHDPSRGMITSVQAAIQNLPTNTTGILVWPVDHPLVKVESARAVLGSTPGKIIVPRHNGKGGHPVRIPRQFFGAISALPGDTSLKSFIDANQGSVVYVDVDDEGTVKDIDTPEEAKAAAAKVAAAPIPPAAPKSTP